MINGKRLAVIMPGLNAEKTLEVTVRELPPIVDVDRPQDIQAAEKFLQETKCS